MSIFRCSDSRTVVCTFPESGTASPPFHHHVQTVIIGVLQLTNVVITTDFVTQQQVFGLNSVLENHFLFFIFFIFIFL